MEGMRARIRWHVLNTSPSGGEMPLMSWGFGPELSVTSGWYLADAYPWEYSIPHPIVRISPSYGNLGPELVVLCPRWI